MHYVDRWVVDCDESLVTATLRPNTVGIANYAFQRSSNNLTSIMIPKSVMSIGYLAFGNCDKLSNITFENISDSQEWFVTVEYYMGTYHYENDDVIGQEDILLVTASNISTEKVVKKVAEYSNKLLIKKIVKGAIEGILVFIVVYLILNI